MNNFLAALLDKIRSLANKKSIQLPAADLPYLFDRFYRVEAYRGRASENHESGGAGVGLTIAQKIARLHQGHIQVESRAGEGTSFIVTLPAADAHIAS